MYYCIILYYIILYYIILYYIILYYIILYCKGRELDFQESQFRRQHRHKPCINKIKHLSLVCCIINSVHPPTIDYYY